MGRRRLLTSLVIFITFSFLSSSYFPSNRSCVNGQPTLARVCSHAGLVDEDDAMQKSVSEFSLMYLLARGVSCHDLDVYWDRNGVFYLGHPRVLHAYNLSLDDVASLSTSDFAEVVQRVHTKNTSSAGRSLPLQLTKLVNVVSSHKLGPISLELKGRHRAEYFDRLSQLYTYLQSLPPPLPARFAVLVFAFQDIKELNTRITALGEVSSFSSPGSSSVMVALTLVDNNTTVSPINISQFEVSDFSAVGVISASWKLWESTQFVISLDRLQKPVMAWNVEHRDYFRFRDLMTSQVVPEYIITNSPLGLVKRLRSECEANPAADELRLRLENKFFLVWSNALPHSIMSYS